MRFSFLHSVWTFLVVERMGYKRESPLTDQDRFLREQADSRIERLQDHFLMLFDEQADLLTRPHRHKKI